MLSLLLATVKGGKIPCSSMGAKAPLPYIKLEHNTAMLIKSCLYLNLK
jgi:hypothetical protein